MSTIREIAARSQKYIDSLSDNIDRVVLGVEDQLTDLNRKQMLLSIGNDEKPLVHTMTGSPRLSKSYGKRMGKEYPDIFVKGEYQKEMFLVPEHAKKGYFISSANRLNEYLPKNYKNLLGINKMNQPKAQEITGNAIAKDFMKTVFNN